MCPEYHTLIARSWGTTSSEAGAHSSPPAPHGWHGAAESAYQPMTSIMLSWSQPCYTHLTLHDIRTQVLTLWARADRQQPGGAQAGVLPLLEPEQGTTRSR
jgi:hypothetical protein